MNHVFQFVVGIISAIVVLGFMLWVLWRLLKRSDDPARLVFKWICTAGVGYVMFAYVAPMLAKGGYEAAFGGVPFAAVCGLALAITWRGAITDLIANPIGSLYDGGREEITPHPHYSIANAKRKQSAPLEAIVEIRQQLARFPNDFEGVMMIADIQAQDLHDLISAEVTINHFCAQSGQLPSQISAALTQLADWHLKFAQDPDLARAALERIIQLFPDSEWSLAAAQRIAHLGDKDLLRARLEPRTFAVAEGIQNMGLLPPELHAKPVEISSEEQTANYLKHLETHPLDMEVREKLAMLYARHYQRFDLAADQLEQMIQTPNQPTKSVVRWLNLLADFQVKSGSHYEAVKQTLERIITAAPEAAAAELARSRIAHLRLAIKGRQSDPEVVKLGIYEQDLGLKNGRN